MNKPLTKAQLIRARQEELGKCKAMVESKAEPKPCKNWAVSEAGYCGQHYASVMNQRMADERAETYRADLQRRITEYLEWKADNPSVWSDS